MTCSTFHKISCNNHYQNMGIGGIVKGLGEGEMDHNCVGVNGLFMVYFKSK